MVSKVCSHVAIETVPLYRGTDPVLRRYIGRCSPNWAFRGLAIATTTGSGSPGIVILSQARHQLIRVLMVAITPQQSHRFVVVPGDCRTEILVTAL